MLTARTVYVLRRLSGLILYGLAYAALWPGITYPVVTLQGNPTFWSNSKLGIGEMGGYLEPVSRSTIELVIDLFNSRYYFPCIVIVLFSIVSPCIKLLVILYGEIVGNIFRIKYEETSKIVDLRKGLRLIAKYQCVDVFVTIITRQLVNSELVLCRVESGFYYFAFYALLSVLAAQLSDIVPVEKATRPASSSPIGSNKMSKLDAFLLFSSISMFVVGQAWALGFPILAVKFLFQSKIVIGERLSSLSSFLESLNFADSQISDVFCASLVGTTCIVMPTIVVGLSTVIQCCDPGRSSRTFYNLSRFTSFLADWSLLDVFAVALLTSLFAFASFSVLRATAPWGFYCVLMAAMSAYEVVKAVQVSLMDAPDGYTRLTPDEDTDTEGTELQRIDDDVNSEARAPPSAKTFVVKSGIVHVIVTIAKRLGLPFFMLKALGWAIFFLVWWMNTSNGSLDIGTLSATLRENSPLVTSALAKSLPEAVGMCDKFQATSTTTDSSCLEKGRLYYEKNKAYEVLAKWMSGFHSVSILDMFVSVPEQDRLSLTVRGKFDQVNLSLFIGQCLGQLFGASEECSSVFDEVHSWRDVKWSIEVEADCATDSPFVRNMIVDEVILESELKLEQKIGWGISLPLEDLSEHFKNGVRDSVQPLLTKKEAWIPWGPKQYDLTSLLSMLVELNADSLGGSIQFSCPKPSR